MSDVNYRDRLISIAWTENLVLSFVLFLPPASMGKPNILSCTRSSMPMRVASPCLCRHHLWRGLIGLSSPG